MLADRTRQVPGEIGKDMNPKHVPAEFEAEVKITRGNARLVFQAARMTYSDGVSAQVDLTSMSLFQRTNAVYTTSSAVLRPASKLLLRRCKVQGE